ncbi:MAG TPA: hypothetical protein VE575_13280, partial [Acidimicrobiales bacterium]|nr:hypothetical protein [Acidimicrobiales bacterium]
RSAGRLGVSQAPGQDGPPDAIVFVEQVNDDGTVYRSWTDEATGRTRRLGMDAAGNPDLEGGYLSVEPGADCDDDPVTLTPPRAAECTRIEERYVDHTQGTYRHNGYTMPGDRSTARVDDGNRRSLRTGSSVEDGLEVVDGRELLRLVDALGARGCATSANGTEVCVDIIPNVDAEWVCEGDAGWTTLSPTTTTPAGGEGPNARASADELSVTEPGALEPPDVDEDECVLAGDLELVDEPSPDPTLGVTWVDPESYRSVKRIGYPGSEAEYTMTFEYLERTSENLALLDVEIPDGYVEETD